MLVIGGGGEMSNDDRYVWLLAHISLVGGKAKRWNPSTDKPLLLYLQDFIDKEIVKVGDGWIKKQREIL